ncbi:MAG: 1-acyl-sn-glycerol-3-phosphate acyltransferase [Alistipes timonensis]|nr:1-acyl-sn-glycerol-3-phosphate acyltransferase [Alistipes timonensis]
MKFYLPDDGRPRPDVHPEIKRTVLDRDDIMTLVPKLQGHPRLVDRLIHFLELDKVNALHAHNADTPGPAFVRGALEDLHIKLRIDNERVLDNLPEGPFITVSNHHFGALDGIMLIDIIGSRRPDFKVMVNMTLNYINAMRENFIAVDPMASDDPKKRAVSMQGIKEVIKRVRGGHPVGFFPAGAVGKVNWRLRVRDREWQPNVVRLIEQLKVPVIPIFFHGTQSWLFNFLGVVCWQARTLMMPHEVFNKVGREMRITVGDPIPVDEQLRHQGSLEEFGKYLYDTTYALRDKYKK